MNDEKSEIDLTNIFFLFSFHFNKKNKYGVVFFIYDNYSTPLLLNLKVLLRYSLVYVDKCIYYASPCLALFGPGRLNQIGN